MDMTSAVPNARYQLQETCSATTKHRGWLVVCDLQLRHQDEHEGVLPNGEAHSWRDEPW